MQSQNASRVAASRELSAASINNLESDPERSILLALEAMSRANTLEAENALHQAVTTSRVQLVVPVHAPGSPISVDYSPNGQRIVTASMEEVVKVWDLGMGQMLFSLPGHYAEFSPDGRHLATVLADGTVKVWDADSGNEIQIPGQMDAITSVSFSPDSKRMVTITNGNLPRVWDMKTGRELASFPGHTDYVSFAFFSPDGEHIITTSDDGTARTWNAFTGEELLVLNHSDWVWNAAFSPDGKRIATVSEYQAFIWDAATGEKLFTLNGHISTVHAVAFSPNGALLVTGSYDRKAIVWDANTGEALFTLAGHTGTIFSAAFSADGTRLVTTSDDGTMRIWDVTLGRGEALTIPYPEGSGGKILYTPNGKALAGIEDGILKLRNSKSGNELKRFSTGGGQVTTFALNPDGSLIAAARDDFNVTIFNLASSADLVTWSAHTGLINALAFSPDGKWLVTASDDYKVKLWELSSEMPSLLFTLHMPVGVSSLDFNSDGSQLAIGLQNGTIRVRDFVAGKDLYVLRGHNNAILSITFSPDDEFLATGSMDGTARIWDVTSGNELQMLDGHTNTVTSVAFNPDGTRLATASRDGTAKLWDVNTGQELLTFLGERSGINSLAFRPDGAHLVTSSDREARIYFLKVDELTELARNRVTRKLSQDECLKYLHGINDACADVVPNQTATPLPPVSNGRICQVTNTGGLNDNYFNELIYKGIQDAAKIHQWDASILQSSSVLDFSRNINTFVDANCQLIVAPGTLVERDSIRRTNKSEPTFHDHGLRN